MPVVGLIRLRLPVRLASFDLVRTSAQGL